MGHERLGLLPKTHRWRHIVSSIPSYASGDPSIDVAKLALEAAGNRFGQLTTDHNVVMTFKCLVELSASDLDRNSNKISTPFLIISELNTRLIACGASGESYELARRAAADAISSWFKPVATGDLFQDQEISQTRRYIRNAGDFSELSRLFFARLTERSLRYFLEREASSKISNFADREAFSERLRRDTEQASSSIRNHAYETASITQSYSAGWFQKYLNGGKRSTAELQRFVSYSLHKLREELKREAD